VTIQGEQGPGLRTSTRTLEAPTTDRKAQPPRAPTTPCAIHEPPRVGRGEIEGECCSLRSDRVTGAEVALERLTKVVPTWLERTAWTDGVLEPSDSQGAKSQTNRVAQYGSETESADSVTSITQYSLLRPFQRRRAVRSAASVATRLVTHHCVKRLFTYALNGQKRRTSRRVLAALFFVIDLPLKVRFTFEEGTILGEQGTGLWTTTRMLGAPTTDSRTDS
jgi:hypothetical protein